VFPGGSVVVVVVHVPEVPLMAMTAVLQVPTRVPKTLEVVLA
jgi:hypothetical protein